MVDYTNYSDVIVDGIVQASGKLKGGEQATEAYDAVLLGSDLKVPSGMLPDLSVEVDLSDYYTKDQVDGLLDDKASKDDVADVVEEILGGGDGSGGEPTGAAYTRVQRLTATGDGASTSLTVPHSLGAVPAVVVYDSSGRLFLTDTTATATDVTLSFETAPGSGTAYTVVVIG